MIQDTWYQMQTAYNSGGTHMVNEALIYALYKIAFQDEKLSDPRADLQLRIKLQKLAYLVQEVLGINLGLNFSMYLYGPYAPALSDIYYDDKFILNVSNARIPDQIEAIREKIKKLGKKDPHWLEVVSTFYSMRKRAKNDKDAVISVTKIKPVTYREVMRMVGEAKKILGV